eukprot:gene19710-22411_t
MTSPNGRLISFAKAGNLEEIENLLNGSATNVNYAEWNGDTAIAMASSFGHFRIVTALIVKGADVNSKDKKGESALMLACNKGFVEIARLLLEHGANIDNQSKVGYTALMGAAMNGSVELIQLLVEWGATIDLKNNAGKVAADFAKTDEVRALLQTRAAPAERNSLSCADLEPSSPTASEAQQNSMNPDMEGSIGANTSPAAVVALPPPPPPVIVSDLQMKCVESQDANEKEVAPHAAETASETSFVARPAAVGFLPLTKPPPPRRGSSTSPVPTYPAVAPPPPMPSAPVLPPAPASTSAPASAASQEALPLPPVVFKSDGAETGSSASLVSQPIELILCPAQAPPAAPPLPSSPVPYILSNGEADLNEHEQVPKRVKVSEMYSRLVLRCQEHLNNDDGESRLPYDVLLRRLQQLQAMYDGPQGLVESARIHEQDCVVEYYALHFEKAQQEALRVLEPPLRRSILTLNAGHSDQKALTKFAEMDEALTRCSQELTEALEALRIETLTLALQRLPRLGPSLAYCFYEHDKKGARGEE